MGFYPSGEYLQPNRRRSALRFVSAFPLFVCLFCLCMGTAIAQEAASVPPQSGQPQQPQVAEQPGGDISGGGKSGNLALPGGTVTAANTLNGEKAGTSTEVDGSYFLHVSTNGRYVVRAELAAFAPLTKEVIIKSANRAARVDLEMILMSRAEEAARQQQRQTAQGTGGGFQRLSVTQTGADSGGASAGDGGSAAGLPTQALGADSATESVSVSGNTQGTDFSMMSSDAIGQRVQELREQQGFGGGGFGGGFGGGGFGGGPMVIFGGGRGRFNINRPHGSLFYSIGDSPPQARPPSPATFPVD